MNSSKGLSPASAISSVTVTKRKRWDPDAGEDGDMVWDDVIKVAFVDKKGCIELMGKFQGIFADNVVLPNGCGVVRDDKPIDVNIHLPQKVPAGAPVPGAEGEG